MHIERESVRNTSVMLIWQAAWLHRGPMSFKQFLLELPDDVTPEQAQNKYDDYRAEFWGSEVPPVTLSDHARGRRLPASSRDMHYEHLCCWSSFFSNDISVGSSVICEQCCIMVSSCLIAPRKQL